MSRSKPESDGLPQKRKAGASKKQSARRPPGEKKAAARKPRPKKAAAPVGGVEKSAPRKSVVRRAFWWGLKATAAFLVLFVLASSVWIVTYRFVNPPLTPLMVLRNVQDGNDVRKQWRDCDDVSKHFLLAVVAAEDQLFFKHRGFDLNQIQAAIETRLDGGKLRGGSTISQQVAKNAFLWPGRSWGRKGLEVWFTAGIELCWSKERILEVYVNVAEMGKGIYGVEAAAQHYYHKPASALSREESALLAAILPAPRERSPARPTAFLRERQAWILKQMRNLGGVEYLTHE